MTEVALVKLSKKTGSHPGRDLLIEEHFKGMLSYSRCLVIW